MELSRALAEAVRDHDIGGSGRRPITIEARHRRRHPPPGAGCFRGDRDRVRPRIFRPSVDHIPRRGDDELLQPLVIHPRPPPSAASTCADRPTSTHADTAHRWPAGQPAATTRTPAPPGVGAHPPRISRGCAEAGKSSVTAGCDHDQEPGDADDHADRRGPRRGHQTGQQDERPEEEHGTAGDQSAPPDTLDGDAGREPGVVPLEGALHLLKSALFAFRERHDPKSGPETQPDHAMLRPLTGDTSPTRSHAGDAVREREPPIRVAQNPLHQVTVERGELGRKALHDMGDAARSARPVVITRQRDRRVRVGQSASGEHRPADQPGDRDRCDRSLDCPDHTAITSPIPRGVPGRVADGVALPGYHRPAGRDRHLVPLPSIGEHVPRSAVPVGVGVVSPRPVPAGRDHQHGAGEPGLLDPARR